MSRRNYGAVKVWLESLIACPPDTDDCIDWPFSLDNNGYAQVNWRGTVNKVPRVVLTELVGPPPAGRRYEAAHKPVVCHKRSCVNPRHLRWATPGENAADKLLDDTHHRGERHGMAKLTESDVLAIYTATGSPAAIGARYGVGRQTVCHIKRGRTWAWLTGHNQENAA